MLPTSIGHASKVNGVPHVVRSHVLARVGASAGLCHLSAIFMHYPEMPRWFYNNNESCIQLSAKIEIYY